MNMNPNLNMDWTNNSDLTETDLNRISESFGYDILIGANNGEDVRRAFQTKPWPNDQEINSIKPEKDDDPQPEPEPTDSKCLTFTAGEGGAHLAFFFNRSGAGEGQQNPNITFQKSTDGGLTWEEHTIGVYDPNDGDTADLDVITLNEGESVMFKGVNSENFTVGDPENDEGIYVGFYLDGSAAASGDITSLINGVGGDATIQFMQFYSMFNDCTGLTQAPALPATMLASGCYDSMFYGCTGITSHDVATLNNSQNTFQSNTSCTSLTIHDDTPPTIGDSTITGLKSDCIIYVPAASVDVYKAAEYWSDRSAYIQAIQ